jgi:myo-inositol-1(or 4)-monophosphatase
VSAVLERIAAALDGASALLRKYVEEGWTVDRKEAGDPVTEADRAVDTFLRETLPRDGEGWLSEETVDDARRLDCSRVWIVDPLDGTKEFVQHIPEWCVSVGYVVEGRPVAGGVHNPATGETILGSLSTGVTYGGAPARVSVRESLQGALVLASRSETGRGQWDHQQGEGFTVRPMGSVAYKMALVAAGRADATWTEVPKNEWDVAAGAALVEAAGGKVFDPEGRSVTFNRAKTLLPGLVAVPPQLEAAVRRRLGRTPQRPR